MKERKSDFERDLRIDKYKLDDECISHPALYYHYSEMAVTAKNEVAVLADILKLKMGEANVAIRNRFTKKEVKFTEAVISAEVEKDESVITAREELREAELNYTRIQAGVSAFEHRKSQLDNLVRLYCAGYFSTPSSTGKPNESINEQAAKAVRKNLNKKKPAVEDEEDEDE